MATDPASLNVIASPAAQQRHVLDPASGLAVWLGQRGQPAWRAAAIRRWLHGRRAASFADMTDLPRDLRADLDADFRIWTTTIAVHQRADDGTEKLLLQLTDGQRIECVLLRDGDRRTVCTSGLTMARRNSFSNSPTASESSACCSATATAAPCASARRWAARWAVYSVPAGSTA